MIRRNWGSSSAIKMGGAGGVLLIVVRSRGKSLIRYRSNRVSLFRRRGPMLSLVQAFSFGMASTSRPWR